MSRATRREAAASRRFFSIEAICTNWRRRASSASSSRAAASGSGLGSPGRARAKAAGGPAEAAPPPPPPPPPPRKGKLSYKDQRDYDLLPARIEELEAAIARDETALHDPALYARDPARFAALTEAVARARADKDAAEERWLALAELVEG